MTHNRHGHLRVGEIKLFSVLFAAVCLLSTTHPLEAAIDESEVQVRLQGVVFDSIALGPIDSVSQGVGGYSLSLLGQTFLSDSEIPGGVGDYVIAAGSAGQLHVFAQLDSSYVPGASPVFLRGLVTAVNPLFAEASIGGALISYQEALVENPDLEFNIDQVVEGIGTQPLVGGAILGRRVLGIHGGDFARRSEVLGINGGDNLRRSAVLGINGGDVARLSAVLGINGGDNFAWSGVLGINGSDISKLSAVLGINGGDVSMLSSVLGINGGDNLRRSAVLGINGGDVSRLSGVLGINGGDVSRLSGVLGINGGDNYRRSAVLGINGGDVSRLSGVLGINGGDNLSRFGVLE